MLTIDGSFGEGGGQILRSSVALAMVTRQAVRIEKIRAGRRRPGLQRQHLTAVSAAAEICAADVQGAAIGSQQLVFVPGDVLPGDYTFDIGSAGSTTLVLQTVLPALLCTAAPSRLTLLGGTHNPLAPPFEFLARAYLPLLARMGPRVEAHLVRHGFYPAGGGRIDVSIFPAPRLLPLELPQRGNILHREARALVARLPAHIGRREVQQIGQKLDWPPDELHVDEVSDSSGPGNVVMITVQAEHVTEVFSSVGQIGKPAERVADEAVRQLRRYLRAEVAVGENLADQLLLPLALAGGGGFSTLDLSSHARTHIALVRQFLDLPLVVEQLGRDAQLVRLGSSVPTT